MSKYYLTISKKSYGKSLKYKCFKHNVEGTPKMPKNFLIYNKMFQKININVLKNLYKMYRKMSRKVYRKMSTKMSRKISRKNF